MYKIFILFFVFLLFAYHFAVGQVTCNESPVCKFPLKCTTNVSEIKNDWFVNLLNIEMPVPGIGNQRSELERIKAGLPAKIRTQQQDIKRFKTTNQNIDKPHIIESFNGNDFDQSVPNDNDLAVSNSGKIISVTNSIIYFFPPDTSAHQVSLNAFASKLGYVEGKYDPRVLYLPDEDKFIIVFLSGFNDSTSHVVVAFSKSNIPYNEWNIYSLPGNPLNDSSWSDFPMIGSSEKELFITFNLLRNDSSWQKGFKQTIIWQIDKSSGFNGDSLITKFYTNVKYNDLKVRNLCPVQSGTEVMTTGMYFLSDKNFSIGCDSFFLGKIDGPMGTSQSVFHLDLIRSDKNYGIPPLATQPKNKLFETNDARILDAFIVNDQIQFVGNTINPLNNFASIFHGLVSNITQSPSISLHIMEHPDLEFGYPSIAFTGNDLSKDESVILFDHTSDTVYPGVSAVFYKGGIYSDILRIHNGETNVRVQSGKNQRWGDYTGLQRQYNDSGSVWGSGYYGKKTSPSYPLVYNVNGTWLVKMKSPTNFDSLKTKLIDNGIVNFPNPVNEMFNVEFYCAKTQPYNFFLYNLNGDLVEYLYHDLVKAGKNVFTFNLMPLRSGMYFLYIINEQGEITKKKIIKT